MLEDRDHIEVLTPACCDVCVLLNLWDEVLGGAGRLLPSEVLDVLFRCCSVHSCLSFRCAYVTSHTCVVFQYHLVNERH
jgi:hypothetical protein